MNQETSDKIDFKGEYSFIAYKEVQETFF